MIEEAAVNRYLYTAVVKPLGWHTYGRAAGPLRNKAMLHYFKPALVIAFSLGTAGTQSTIDEARRLGIPVEVIGTERA